MVERWGMGGAASRSCLVLGLLLILAACGPSEPRPHLAGPVALTVLHSADLHSEIEPQAVSIGVLEERLGLGLAGGQVTLGGVARLAQLARAQRRTASRALHLDAGDALSGTQWFERHDGAVELEALAAAGVDAMALGNHEFDVSPDRLRGLARNAAGFPLLAANYHFDQADVAAPYALFDLDGLKVAVIGLGNEGSIAPDAPSRFAFSLSDPVAALERVLADLPETTDVVLVLSHLGHERDLDLARHDRVALVLGGHNHFASTELTRIDRDDGSTGLIAQVGSRGRLLGRIDLTLERRWRDGAFEVVRHAFELLPVDDSLGEDPAVNDVLARYEAPRPTPLAFAQRAIARTADTATGFGDLVAESLRRSAPGVDVGLINATAVRSGVPAGLVYDTDLARALPFDDEVVLLDLDGSALLTLLSDVARRSADRDCRAEAHLAGVRLSLDCGACADGGTCPFEAALVACSSQRACRAEAIEERARYRVASSDFVVSSRRYAGLERGVRVMADAGHVNESVARLLSSAPPCGASCTIEVCGEGAGCWQGGCGARCPLEGCMAALHQAGQAGSCAGARARCSGLACLRSLALPDSFETRSAE